MTDVYMANILENNKNVSQRNTTYYEFASQKSISLLFVVATSKD